MRHSWHSSLTGSAKKADGAGAIPNSLPADDVNKDGASKSVSMVVQPMASVVATVLCSRVLLFPTTGHCRNQSDTQDSCVHCWKQQYQQLEQAFPEMREKERA